MEAEHNQLKLTPDMVMDGRVGELFRYRWPAGYPRFAATALECLNTLRPWATVVSQTTESGRAPDTRAAIGRLLQTRPITARLPLGDLLEVLLEVQRYDAPWEVQTCGARALPGFCARRYRCQRAQYAPLGGLPRGWRPTARPGAVLPWCSIQAVVQWHPATVWG